MDPRLAGLDAGDLTGSVWVIPYSHTRDASGLFLHIDPGSGVPIYRQIMDGVRYSVATGQIGRGDRLPSVRELAPEVSRGERAAALDREIRALLSRAHELGVEPSKLLALVRRALEDDEDGPDGN